MGGKDVWTASGPSRGRQQIVSYLSRVLPVTILNVRPSRLPLVLYRFLSSCFCVSLKLNF